MYFIVLVTRDADSHELAAEDSLISVLALVGELVLVGGGRDDLLGGEEDAASCGRAHRSLHFVPVGLGLLVLDIVGPVSKGLAAGLALERLLPGVDSDMGLQSEGVREELTADVTLVFLLGRILSFFLTVIGYRPISLDLSWSRGSR